MDGGGRIPPDPPPPDLLWTRSVEEYWSPVARNRGDEYHASADSGVPLRS